jgi:M6 family metalloprotease-like protein
MTKRRAMNWPACAAAALLALAPSDASAQSGIDDVIMAGRAHGVELPAEVVAALRAMGPDAFEFQRVWKARAARVLQNRAAFDAADRERPVRGAASVVTTAQLQAAAAVLDGTFRMPILLGRPTDGTEPHSAAQYQARMFGAGTTNYSLTTFYAEMSQGAFDFTGTVIEWADLPSASLTYYGTGNTNIFGNTLLFLNHTLAAVDGSVDFSQYDNDGPDGVPNSLDDDGFVDLAAFMYPAIGRECGAGNTGIWAHRFFMAGWGNGAQNYTTNDPATRGGNVRVSDYIIQGGIDCDGSQQEIGVVAHEAGHGFGIPDLYDTDATTNVSQGIGEWGLMGSGNWNQPHSPAHMEAHSKMLLGWIDVVTILRDTALTIEPIVETPVAYRININGVPREYFMLENRQRIGSDAFLNGTGLLIWHVDSVTYANGIASNSVNATQAHKGLDLEEADGLNHLDVSSSAANARGDAGDPWPGSSNRSTFNGTSNPSSATYSSGASNVEITNIVETPVGDITLFVNVPDLVTYGDVNDDDVVTDADLVVVMSYAIGSTGPDYTRIAIADVDDDGDVDARDAFIIQAYLQGGDTDDFRVGQAGIE